MFKFISKFYTQAKNLYNIKKIINKINSNVGLVEYSSDIQQSNFNELRDQIFKCGSLYVKFLQWYISKLKSNAVYQIENIEKVEKDNKNQNNNIIEYQYIKYFENIFEQCPYHNIEHTLETFKKIFPDLILDEYIDITTFKVIASGSIGQVYYAKTLEGQEIAIKVKHPNIDTDLQDQKPIITFIKYIQSIYYFKRKFNLFFNIDDFLSDINLQCDFNNEAENIKLFINYYKDSDQFIVFPKILMQSRDILISEYIHGDSFDILNTTQKSNGTLSFICFFYQMLLVDNFVHGDLHCKNWKVRVNPNNCKDVQLIIYDCGICFKNINVELTRDFWFAIGKYDVELLAKTLKQFIIISKNTINDDVLDIEIKNLLFELDSNILGTNVIIKTILNFFSNNNIIIHKFLINFSILMCLIEEFFKNNYVINSDNTILKSFNMYDIINESQLNVIAFTDIKNCFTKVGEIFKCDLQGKYQKYNNNILKNNIDTNGKIIEKKLFNNLSMSKLKFNPPE